MAPAVVKRAVAAALVALAATLLVAAALWGGDERRSLGKFEPAGPMRATDLSTVRTVEVRKGEQTWRFERQHGVWRAAHAATPTQLQALDDALTLLRNAAPERRFARDERPDDAAVGLAPPQLVVRVESESRFAIDLGGANPIGLARYARVAGDPATLLLPRYVADTWEAVVGLREPPTGGAR